MGGVAAVRGAARTTWPSSASRRAQKGTTAAGAAKRARVGTLGVVGVHPAHHGLGMASGAPGQARGAPALRDLEEGERALPRAGVGRAHSQAAQVLR
jgi:hypothetical protein